MEKGEENDQDDSANGNGNNITAKTQLDFTVRPLHLRPRLVFMTASLHDAQDRRRSCVGDRDSKAVCK